MQRCNATVTFNSDANPVYPPTVNDERLHEHFQKIAGHMVGAKNVKEMQPLMGAEDFSFYQEVIPGHFSNVGMGDDKKGVFESGHSPFFTVNEDVLPYGAALHASLAATYLLENQPESHLPKESSHDEL